MLTEKNYLDLTEDDFYSFLAKIGYKKSWPLQQTFVPALQKNRDLIFEAAGGEGKQALLLAFLFQLLHFPSKEGIKGLILLDSPGSVQKLKQLWSRPKLKPRERRLVGFIGIQNKINLDLGELGQKPKVIVSTTMRAIDLLRQDQLKGFNPHKILLDSNKLTEEEGLKKDLDFILSKIPVRGQRIILTPHLQEEINWEEHLKLPQIIPRSTWMQGEVIQSHISFSNSENKIKLLPRLLKEADLPESLILFRDQTLLTQVSNILQQSGISVEQVNQSRYKKQQLRKTTRLGLFSLRHNSGGEASILFFQQPEKPEDYYRILTLFSHKKGKSKAIHLISPQETSEFQDLQEMLKVGINKNQFQEELLLVKETTENIIRHIKEEEDLDEMAYYKKLFKKSVPFHLRSYFAAYLLKNSLGKSFKKKESTRTLFVSIGKNRRVYPRDLVGYFSNAAGIQKRDIGDIKILDSYSFMEVNTKVAEKAIKALDGSEFRGRRITVNYAKKRS